MTRLEFEGLCNAAFNIIRQKAPFDTGNLSSNSLRMIFEDENTCRIYIDENIAPYMPYTNEPWVSQWWRGKQNPNLYWFDQAANDVMRILVLVANGDLSRTDNGKFIDTKQMAIDFQNKHGDYTEDHALMHSTFILDSADPFLLGG